MEEDSSKAVNVAETTDPTSVIETTLLSVPATESIKSLQETSEHQILSPPPAQPPSSMSSSPARVKNTHKDDEGQEPTSSPPPLKKHKEAGEDLDASIGGDNNTGRERSISPEKKSKMNESPQKKMKTGDGSPSKLSTVGEGSYWKMKEGKKRERKTVESFQVADHREGKELEIKEGKGTRLGEIEGIIEAFKKITSKEPLLKTLHSLFYGRVAKAAEVKGNLMNFSGLVYEEESDDGSGRHKVEEKAHKMVTADLKRVCDILGVNRSGRTTKNELVEVLVDWMEKPTAGAKKSGGSSSSTGVVKKTKGSADSEKKKKKGKSSTAKKQSQASGKKKKKKTRLFSASSSILSKKRKIDDEEEEKTEKKKKAKKDKPTSKEEEDSSIESPDEEEMEEEEEEEEEEREEEEEGGGDDDEDDEKRLEEAVRKVVEASDPTSITIKQVMAQLSEMLGRDVSEEKAKIKNFVSMALS